MSITRIVKLALAALLLTPTLAAAQQGSASPDDAYAKAAQAYNATSPDAVAARRIIAAQPLGDISAVMATPPVLVTAATDGANSTIQTSATIAIGGGVSGNAENAATCSLLGAGPGAISGGRLQVITRVAGARIAQFGSGIGCQSNAAEIDFALRANGQNFIIYVTDLVTGVRARVAANDIAPVFTGTNGVNYYKLVWGAQISGTISGTTLTVNSVAGGALAVGQNLYGPGVAGGTTITGGSGTSWTLSTSSTVSTAVPMSAGVRSPRVYEVYAANLASFAGVNVPTGDSVAPPAATQLRFVGIGDSFWEASVNSITQNIRLQLPYWVAAYLGVSNPIINGIGSTGVIATAGASNYNNFASRVAAGDIDRSRIGDADIVFAGGSINDNNPTNGGLAMPSSGTNANTATLQAAYQAYIAAVMVAQPNAIIIGYPQEFANGQPALSPQAAAYKAGFLAAAGGQRRMIWLDGTIYARAAADSGLIGADNVHPGGPFAGRIIGQSLAASAVAGTRVAYGY